MHQRLITGRSAALKKLNARKLLLRDDAMILISACLAGENVKYSGVIMLEAHVFKYKLCNVFSQSGKH